MRYAKRDNNHKAVADYLSAHGVEVIEIFNPLDLLCQYRGFVGFVEVKMDDKKELCTRKQLKFIAETRIPVAFAKSGEDALNFLQTRSGLTERQKNGITAMLRRDEKLLFTAKDMRTVLEI